MGGWVLTMSDVFIGIAIGVALTIPLSVIAVRRTSRRIRQLEQRARSAERLAELGTLTGGLAHEIKNPLSTVGLNIQLLQEDLATLEQESGAQPGQSERIGRIRRRFETLTRETARLRQTLDDFLRFAGRVKLRLTPADINTLVQELADFFQPQAASQGIQLRTQCSPQPIETSVDADLFKQAMLNLMINAAQAMSGQPTGPDGTGRSRDLMLRTERRRVAGRNEAVVHVIDTGPGIDAKTLEKIFHPYFSTKKGGTGLGLPTTRRIIEEHGGTITAHSEVGRGTDFMVSLPIQESL